MVRSREGLAHTFDLVCSAIDVAQRGAIRPGLLATSTDHSSSRDEWMFMERHLCGSVIGCGDQGGTNETCHSRNHSHGPNCWRACRLCAKLWKCPSTQCRRSE